MMKVVKRPGRMSSFRLAGGTLTVQTEVLSSPRRTVTLVDYRGRVLRRVEHRIPVVEIPSIRDAVLYLHQEVERDVRAQLERVCQRRTEAAKGSPAGTSASPTASRLFVLAVEAVHVEDYPSALEFLDATLALVPDSSGARELRQVVAARLPTLDQGAGAT